MRLAKEIDLDLEMSDDKVVSAPRKPHKMFPWPETDAPKQKPSSKRKASRDIVQSTKKVKKIKASSALLIEKKENKHNLIERENDEEEEEEDDNNEGEDESNCTKCGTNYSSDDRGHISYPSGNHICAKCAHLCAQPKCKNVVDEKGLACQTHKKHNMSKAILKEKTPAFTECHTGTSKVKPGKTCATWECECAEPCIHPMKDAHGRPICNALTCNHGSCGCCVPACPRSIASTQSDFCFNHGVGLRCIRLGCFNHRYIDTPYCLDCFKLPRD